MAEHFRGKLRSLHTTAGGGVLFMNALVAFGEQSASGDGPVAACLLFIRERIAKGNGWYHIPAYPLPEALRDPTALAFLASTIDRLVQSLIDDNLPAPLSSEFYNRDLRMRWAAFALEFYELLQESGEFDLPVISLNFQEAEDLSVVNVHRLRLRLTDAQKTDDPIEQLRLLSEIVSLEKSGGKSEYLSSTYLQKAELELRLGCNELAIESLIESASYAIGEDREMLLETAETIRKQGQL